MKRLLFILYVACMAIGVLTSACGTAAAPEQASQSLASLEEAFTQISSLPAFSRKKSMDSMWIDTPQPIENARTAVAAGMSDEQVRKTGDAIYTILDKLPLASMVNGASNRLVMGMVYANPTASGDYEVLMVAASGYMGYAWAAYGTTDSATVATIRYSPLIMQGPNIRLMMPTTASGEMVNLINISGN